MVGTKAYRIVFSCILSGGGPLYSDWLPPNRVIAYYHKVDLFSTPLAALAAGGVNAQLRPFHTGRDFYARIIRAMVLFFDQLFV